MNSRALELLSSICADVPADARLIDAEAYRHDDFGPAMVGVQLEFDTGHLHLVTVAATADLDEIEADIAAQLVMRMAARPQEAHA